MSDHHITRREALAMTGSAALAAMLPGHAAETVAKSARPALTIFARHLNWAGIEEAIEVAVAAGFGGIAWTVRKGAHIEPQNVARDLRRAVELSHRAGLSTTHVVTALNDTASPYAEAIVETVAGLGIRRYRMQTGRYNYAADVPAQWEALKRKVEGLVRLNDKYDATALIHTHGGLVGGAVWDTWLMLRDFDPNRVGINFDTGYGFYITGAGWREAVRFARRHIGLISLKDFRWKQTTQDGKSKWGAELCVPGQGMVDFQEMLGYFKSTDFHGPAEVQFEYPVPVPGTSNSINLMTRDVGEWKLEMPKADFIAALKRDVDFYAALLKETGLEPAR